MYRTKIFVERTASENCYWFNRVPAILIGCDVSDVLQQHGHMLFENIRMIWQPEICVDYADGKYFLVRCDNPFESFDRHIRYVGGFVHYSSKRVNEDDPLFLEYLDDVLDSIADNIIFAKTDETGNISVAITSFDLIRDGEKYRRVFYP